jgi:hypothetical protein
MAGLGRLFAAWIDDATGIPSAYIAIAIIGLLFVVAVARHFYYRPRREPTLDEMLEKSGIFAVISVCEAFKHSHDVLTIYSNDMLRPARSERDMQLFMSSMQLYVMLHPIYTGINDSRIAPHLPDLKLLRPEMFEMFAKLHAAKVAEMEVQMAAEANQE